MYQTFHMPSEDVFPGFGKREIAVFFLVLIIGIAAFSALGIPQVQKEKALTDTSVATWITDTQRARNVLWTYEQNAGSQSASAHTSADATNTDAKSVYYTQESYKDALSLADERGFSAQTTDAEIEAAAPKTEVVTEDAIPAMVRIVVCLIIPLALLIGVCIEFEQGTSLRREIARYITSRKEKKVFGYTPAYFIQEEEDTSCL